MEHISNATNPFSEAPERKAARAALYHVLHRPDLLENDAIVVSKPLTDTEIDTALRSLTNRSLVVPSDEFKTFTLVPMVADFLRKRKPEVVAETGDWLEKHAYALITENGYHNHACFPALEVAWPGIAPALPLFLAGDNARLQTVCGALVIFLDFQGRWDEWLALDEKAEARAVAAADHYNAGWRAYHVGMIHHSRQQADAVLSCANRAATHWDRAKSGARERAVAICLRGLGYKLKMDYPAAIAAFRESLELHRSLAAESADVGTVLNELGETERLSSDFASAEVHYREALRVARAVGYLDGLVTCTGNLASLALNRQDWPTAENLAREALSLAEKLHRQKVIASNNLRLAHALLEQRKLVEALPYAQRAVDIFTRLSSPELAVAQTVLAECKAAVQ